MGSERNVLEQITAHEDVESTIQEYNRTAHDYDAYFTRNRYGAPHYAADAVIENFPEGGDKPRSEVKVFDVAAGTGIIAQRLYDAGFRDMDGLDASEEMVAIAKQRNLYDRLLIDTIGDHRIDVEDNMYDVVTLAGGFLPGHCPVSTVPEMLRICKPGGLVIFVMRLRFLIIDEEYRKMEPLIQSMEQKGFCKCLSRDVKPGYVEDHEGVVYTIRKMRSDL